MDKFIIGDYTSTGTVLGKGVTSTVFAGVHNTTQQRVAIKRIVLRHAGTRKIVERELSVMRMLDHPNVLRLLDFYKSAQTPPTYFFILEYCNEGTLGEWMHRQPRKRADEAHALCFMRQVVDAMFYMHTQQVVHRDIKPHNIMLHRDGELQLKIGDFGLARTLHDGEMAQTIAGSPRYMAPEILQAHASCGMPSYSDNADMWSLGALLYEMLVGHALFHEATTPDALVALIEGNDMDAPMQDLPNTLSHSCKAFVRTLLTKDSTKRLSWAQCRMHPWLQHQAPVLEVTFLNQDVKETLEETRDEPVFHLQTESSALLCNDLSDVQVLTRVVDGVDWLFTMAHDAMSKPLDKQQGVQVCHTALRLTRALQQHVQSLYLLHPVCDRLDDYALYNDRAIRRALGWGSVCLSPQDGSQWIVERIARAVEMTENTTSIAQHYALLLAMAHFHIGSVPSTLLHRCQAVLEALE